MSYPLPKKIEVCFYSTGGVAGVFEPETGSALLNAGKTSERRAIYKLVKPEREPIAWVVKLGDLYLYAWMQDRHLWTDRLPCAMRFAAKAEADEHLRENALALKGRVKPIYRKGAP